MPRARKEKPRSRGLAKSRINHSPPLDIFRIDLEYGLVETGLEYCVREALAVCQWLSLN